MNLPAAANVSINCFTMKKIIVLLLLVGVMPFLKAQELHFTQQDSLRGSITPERAWWDLAFYDLKVNVDPNRKFISGSNTIRYRVIEAGNRMQLDLQPPMKLLRAVQDGQDLPIEHNGNAHYISLKEEQVKGKVYEITAYYEGFPKEAVRAPWDGGFSWKTDTQGNPFVATSCQGLGASVWWPNKDHMYDEVDSMSVSLTVPKPLTGVSNGRLRKVTEGAQTTTYNWFVANPINNYGVNANIAVYSNFKDVYEGEKGALDLNYYVLPENLEKAKIQFGQVPMMLEAFEYWFGPYPFYEDSYKLVEVPYLGMEHQSSVTYGNHYQNGYLGRDLSGTGWGLKFDFIIIHESGHEWFANNITYRDIADMWIHESFTAYSENLYLDYHYGRKAAEDYVIGTRANILNDRPIIGTYGVNYGGSGDMYYKGANMLHTLRQLVEDDSLWRKMLRGLNKTFYHQTVTTAQIENYLSETSGKDLSAFFNQYLRTTLIPVLEYRLDGNTLYYRYTNIVEDFDMPLRVTADQEEFWLFPDAGWKTKTFSDPVSDFKIDRNFYVNSAKSARS
jgi:aminopeptidase N